MEIAEYTNLDGLSLAEAIARGELSATEAVKLARAAAENVNDSLNAVVAFLDQPVSAKPAEGACFVGVPTFQKDLGAGFVGQKQESGSRVARGQVAPLTAYFSQRMVDAGLQILGRTTCPEFGLTMTTESVATGITRNPWNTEHITGGSSGGSAALVAAGVVPLAHTNDGGGSTRIPASICGNVGLKASRGRISLGPILNDVSMPLIAEGCNSRTVRDTAAFLDAVCKPSLGEATFCATQGSFLQGLLAAPKKYRIAVSLDDWGNAPMDSVVRSEVERIANSLRQRGHQVEEATPNSVHGDEAEKSFQIMWCALAHLTVTASAMMTGNTPGPDALEPITLQMYEAGARVTALEHALALSGANNIGRDFAAFFQEWDLILTPTLNRGTPEVGSPLTLSSDLKLDDWFEAATQIVPHTPVANMTGIPAISVPCAIGPGNLPLGMQFMAPMGGEAALLDIAQQLEESEPWIGRRPTVFASGT
ncbi:MAG: amidase [Halioglobus sp.]|jgi:amidase